MRRSHDRPDANESNMDPFKKLHTRPGYPFSRPNNNPKRSARSNLSLTVVASVATITVLLFGCYVHFSGNEKPLNSNPLKYAVVLDGGSTGTRIHVFGYRVEEGKPVLDFGSESYASLRVNPGLSAFAEDPVGVSGSMEELVEFGRGKVPEEVWGETEVRLMATAGMRRLEMVVRDRILNACRRVLRGSGFKFRDEWVEVISGADEGMYAWVVANYALGSLGGDPLKTTGIIELGGASAQVTFVSSEPMPLEFSRSIKFGNFNYNLYSHSFLHFGQNVAFDSLRESLISRDFHSATESLEKGISIDPCSPKGYTLDVNLLKLSSSFSTKKREFISSIQAGGNFSECRSAALTFLQKERDKCPYQKCYLGSVFMPKLQGKFLATENFFHTSKFFRLGQKALLSDFMMAGEQFCGEDWSKLKTKYPSLREEDLLPYCFSSAYIVAILHDSLGISLDDERIIFANKVGVIPLDWALGAFILQNTANFDDHHGWIYRIIGNSSPTLLYLIGISIVLTFLTWSISKWRKPQFKTVYDLEKGRYIVTRAR